MKKSTSVNTGIRVIDDLRFIDAEGKINQIMYSVSDSGEVRIAKVVGKAEYRCRFCKIWATFSLAVLDNWQSVYDGHGNIQGNACGECLEKHCIHESGEWRVK